MDTSLSHVADMSAATKLFSEAFLRSLKGFAMVFEFRRIACIGLKSSFSDLLAYVTQLLYDLETNPDFAGIIVSIDPNVPPRPGWSRRIVATSADYLVRQQQQSFSVAVDAASLVFAHSILDDAALQYCQVTAMVSPSSWEQLVLEKKVQLRDVRSNDYENLLKRSIQDYIDKLERESLITKSQKLFEVCRPEREFQPIMGFSYDRGRLEGLDRLRHDIVHGAGPVNKLPNGDDDLYFMQQCGLYLMTLVNHRFGVRIEVSDL